MPRAIAWIAIMLTALASATASAEGLPRHNTYVGLIGKEIARGDTLHQAVETLKGLTADVRQALNNGIASSQPIDQPQVVAAGQWQAEFDGAAIAARPERYSHYLVGEYQPDANLGFRDGAPAQRVLKVTWHVGKIVQTPAGRKVTVFGVLPSPTFVSPDKLFWQNKMGADYATSDRPNIATKIADNFKILFPDTRGKYAYYIMCFDGKPETAANAISSILWRALAGDFLGPASDPESKACRREPVPLESSDIIITGSLKPRRSTAKPHPSDRSVEVVFDDFVWQRRNDVHQRFCFCFNSASEEFNSGAQQLANQYDWRLDDVFDALCAKMDDIENLSDARLLAQDVASVILAKVRVKLGLRKDEPKPINRCDT